MRFSIIRSIGEAYAAGFLASAVLDSFTRVEREEVTALDVKRLKQAKEFLRDARAGYRLHLGEHDVDSELEQRPLPKRRLSHALALAIQVWITDEWRLRHQDFAISRESVEQELDEYIESIQQALHGPVPTEEIPGWKKTRDFFTGLIHLAVDQSGQTPPEQYTRTI